MKSHWNIFISLMSIYAVIVLYDCRHMHRKVPKESLVFVNGLVHDKLYATL